MRFGLAGRRQDRISSMHFLPSTGCSKIHQLDGRITKPSLDPTLLEEGFAQHVG